MGAKGIIKLLFVLFITSSLFISCNNEDDYEIDPPVSIAGEFQIVVGDDVFSLSIYDNEAANLFREMLPLTLNMNEMNGNEKYGELPNTLPTTRVRPAIINNGDLMLYGDRTLVLFYKTFSNSYNYTYIGCIDNPQNLETALGRSGVVIHFEQK